MSHYTTTGETEPTTVPPSFVQTDAEWLAFWRRLPADAEAQAHTTGAFQRRRGVPSPQALLRLVLAYAYTAWGLRLVATWAALLDIAQVSDVALLNRLRGAHGWLSRLVATLLLGVQLGTPPVARLRLVDATAISAPGSTGTDWRVHLSFDLAALRLDAIELTDVHGAEGLPRVPPAPGDLFITDSGYARVNDLGWLGAHGGQFITRTGWSKLCFHTTAGARWDLLPWLQALPPDPVTECALHLVTTSGTCPVRLLAVRLPPAAVEQARRRLKRQAAKKGYTTREGTRIAAAFCLIVTNLPAAQWSSAQVLALYRVRWQVELAIKRLQGVWQLDDLRAHDPELAQTYLLGKLLGALLAQDLTLAVQAACPDWFGSVTRPVSLWRLQQLEFACLRQAVLGPLTWAIVASQLATIRRFLCDTPRKKRPQLLAWARDWLRHGSLTTPETGRLASPPREETKN